MNLQKLESRRVQAMASIFHEAARHVPAEKAQWKPDPKAKSAREIVEHLTGANHFFAALLRGEPQAPPTGESIPKSYEDALQAFQESAAVLAEATASVPDDRLQDAVELPWGQSWKMTMLLAAASGHIAYHWGQIGYLQTLWGDEADYHLIP
jgi:uncharacterized damage-inducible protein DinB